MTDQLIPGREYILLYPFVDDRSLTVTNAHRLKGALEAGGARVVGIYLIHGVTQVQFVDVTPAMPEPDPSREIAQLKPPQKAWGAPDA